MKRVLAMALVLLSATSFASEREEDGGPPPPATPQNAASQINPYFQYSSKAATCAMLNRLPGDTDPARGAQQKVHADAARSAGLSEQGVFSFANAFDIRLRSLCSSQVIGEEFTSALRASWQETCTQAFPGLTQRVIGTQRAIVGSDLYKCRRADADYISKAAMFQQGFQSAQQSSPIGQQQFGYGFGQQQFYGFNPFMQMGVPWQHPQGAQTDCGAGVNDSEMQRGPYGPDVEILPSTGLPGGAFGI